MLYGASRPNTECFITHTAHTVHELKIHLIGPLIVENSGSGMVTVRVLPSSTGSMVSGVGTSGGGGGTAGRRKDMHLAVLIEKLG